MLDCLQVVICELAGEHGEEPREAFGTEARRLLSGDLPQPPEHADMEFQYLDRAAEDPVGTGVGP